MNQVIAWAGFLGAWLLVAGPLYQGALELREEEVDREAIESTKANVPRPDPPSAWWWLVPPVMYVLFRRRSHAYRQAVMDELTPAQRQQLTSFINKAAGWFTVAIGAGLLAADETWQITDHHHWPLWVFGLMIVVMTAACILNTSARMIQGEREAARAVQQAQTGF